jgi:hypothetical protein
MTGIPRDAGTGYRDLVGQNFPGFGWALGLNSVGSANRSGRTPCPSGQGSPEVSGKQPSGGATVNYWYSSHEP